MPTRRMTSGRLFQHLARGAACCAFTLLTSAGAMHAQEKFRTGVDVVRVDVLVMDGGRPFAGLEAADFESGDEDTGA